MRTLFRFITLFAFTPFLHAQPHALSLSDCIERAHSTGPSARIYRANYSNRLFTYRAFNASLLPSLRLEGIVPDLARTINPIIQPDGSTKFIEQSQANSTMAVTLSQPLVFSGGNIFISSGLAWNRMLNDNLTTWRSSPLLVGIQQPLFQLNTLWWDNRQNEIRLGAAQKKFNEDAEEASIEMTDKFFAAYVAQMRVENATLNVTINDSLLTLSRGRFEVGKIDENDLLQSELALANAQTERSNAELDYQIAMRSLAIALGYDPEEALSLIAPMDVLSIEPTVPKAISEARENRSDWDDYELQETIAERNINQARHSNGFNATVTASFGLNQTAPELNSAYHDLLDQQLARIDVSIPLWQWNKGSYDVQAAEADLDRIETTIGVQKKSFNDNVAAEVQRYLRNREQLKLSLKADTIAQKQYTLASNRYLIGKYDVTKLLLSQDAKDRARQSLVTTLREYWLSYYRLRRMTLYDFVENRKINYLPNQE